MRIVHVTPFYYPVIGGVEEVVRRIAEYMASKGHDVYVLTYNRLRVGGKSSLPRNDTIGNVKVVRVEPNFTWSHGTYSSEVPRILEELKPDFVHVHVWRHPHVFQVARLRRNAKFKSVLHGHAPFHTFNQLDMVTWIYHKLVDILYKGYLRFYDVYIALTPHEVRRVNCRGCRVMVIPNGVEEDNCPVNGGRIVRSDYKVLYLGRISRSKNLDLLARAMVYVVKEVRDVELIMAGPDEGIVKGLLEYVMSRGVRIMYLGEVDESEKHRLYMESTIYTLPSLYEPYGITLLEAGLHGTPSVITGEGGQLYVAPPGIASLWAKPHPRDYAKAIVMLLTDKNLREKLGRQAREWAQRHTWGKILPRYEKLYEELVDS